MSRHIVFLSSLLVCLALQANRAQADPVGYVDSTDYPIRVYYEAGLDATTVQEALGYAEFAWEEMVVGMGFPEPWTLDASGNPIQALYVYLDPQGEYSHAQPLADVPSTPWTDCAVDTLVTTAGSLPLESTMFHEINHALQMSADCTEAPFAYENTTTAVTTMVYPDDPYFTQYMLPIFQGHPHHGLDCTFFGDQVLWGYHYGASLFQLFLEDYYGDYDGQIMAALWQATKQNGTVTLGGMGPTSSVPNEPDLMDAYDTVLANHNASFLEAFPIFARWRYFLGPTDDGEHFRDADHWTGGAVALDEQYAISDLPLTNAEPTDLPNEFGTVYFSVSLGDLPAGQGLDLSFIGTADVSWHVDALLIKPDLTADVQNLTLDANQRGTLFTGSLDDYDKVVYVVSNLSDGEHDADSPGCNNTSSFLYDLDARAAVTMEITEVQPRELDQGQSTFVWVRGTGFSDPMTVSFDSPGITVTSVEFVDETTLSVGVDIATNATPGVYSVTVQNSDSESVTLQSAVVIRIPPSAGGCDCSTTGGGAGSTVFFLLLGLLAALRLGRPRNHEGRPRNHEGRPRIHEGRPRIHEGRPR